MHLGPSPDASAKNEYSKMGDIMSEALATSPPAGGLLDRDRSVAGPRFNRWLVPPAALAIHLCIGMGYGFSV